MKNVELIEDKVAFKFLADVDNSGFTGKTNSGLIVKSDRENQVNNARWGIVINVAPSVTEVTEGDYILIEPMGWTNQINMEEAEDDKFWVTTESRIMAVTEDEPTLI